MLDDGLIKLAIKSVTDTDIVCEVLNSGKIKTKKGVNVPGVHLSMPYLSQRDRDDIIFGVQQASTSSRFLRAHRTGRLRHPQPAERVRLQHPHHRQDREP